MTDYNMHILALDDFNVNTTTAPINAAPPVNVYSFRETEVVNEDTEFIVPTITTEGRISFLSAGKANDLPKLWQGVSDKFAPKMGQLFSEGISNIHIGNFAVVGVAFHLPDVSDMRFIVFETLVFPKPLPELERIYSSLKIYCEVGGTIRERPIRSQIQSYFAQELQKKWINEVITGWKQRLNWGKIVDAEIKEIKRGKAKY